MILDLYFLKNKTHLRCIKIYIDFSDILAENI